MEQVRLNVLDKYREWTQDLIKEDVQKNTFPVSVLMFQFVHDFNIGTVIRNANSFGCRNIYYVGPKKHIDRRGSQGSYLYKNIVYLKLFEDFVKLKEKYTFVGLENNVPNTIMLDKFDWKLCQKEPLILIGEEGCGLNEETIKLCDYIVEIESFGSIRSINAGCASGIALYDFVSKYKK